MFIQAQTWWLNSGLINVSQGKPQMLMNWHTFLTVFVNTQNWHTFDHTK